MKSEFVTTSQGWLLVEMSLTACGLDFFFFFNSRQKQLEAIKQLQEGAVNQEAILRKKVQEASQRLEDAEEQVGWPLTILYLGEASSDVFKTMR